MSTPVTPKIRMTVSEKGIAFIKRQEGCILHMYDDSAGNCTIGIGHLVHLGKTGTNPVAEEPYWNGCTMEQAIELLNHDLANTENAINDYVDVPLTQNQFDALVDFCFELGAARLLHSTLLQVLNAGNYASVPSQLERWIYTGGSPSNGLQRRRGEEIQLWNS